MERHRIGWIPAALAVMVLVASAAFAGDDTTANKVRPKVVVEQWLILGPIAAPLPAYNDEYDKSKTGAGELLSYPHISLQSLAPVTGAGVALIGGGDVTWSRASADTNGVAFDGAVEARGNVEVPSFVYMAAYVDVPRWMKVDVEVRSHHPVEAFIAGESVAKQAGANKKGDASASGTAGLEKGKHLLVVKTVNVPADSAGGWSVAVTLSPAAGFETLPVVSLDPRRAMTIEDVVASTSIGGIDVSPDGEMVMLALSKRRGSEGTRDGWREIRRVRDGVVLHTLRDIDGSDWQWAPGGKRVSYVSRTDKKATLRVYDLDSAAFTAIVEDVEDFAGYRWSPDGTYVVYSVSTEPEKSKTGVKRMRGISDRRTGERNRSSLYLASVPAGLTRRLTAGKYSARLLDVHPDSRTLLINRSYEDLGAKPYAIDELVVLDVDDANIDVLWTGRGLGGGLWSPDGKTLLLTGGPSTFGGVGENVPDGAVANQYDTQAYLFDPETKAVEAITRDFDPDVQSYWWPRGDDIYFVGGNGEFDGLYRYNTKKGAYKQIELPTDVLHSRDVARDRAVAVMAGSGANAPWRVFSIDLKSGRSRTMIGPAENFKNVSIGKVTDFNFTSSAGVEIVGRVHYPPDFDPGKSWPAIVYYYGGTSPVTRSFGGRYPKNLWAANGYVVYVLQPSGATGFGQAFSAVHVNDWGKTTADEVIEGTKAFLAAHPFVDAGRVGCIGASFGGFMTQLLVTKTDIFAAAVSHAGISDISSYWGEGYWGYQYNAVSAAESFPWNRRDIYVDQSPLFNADKIVTPLLLLHGDSDTNVPRGESDQMYAALKLLGKEVEYIRVEGEDHWILDYKKRIVWSDAIVSWFDRWLKGEPEWWNDMYPPLGDAADADQDEEDDDNGRPRASGRPPGIPPR